MTAPPLLDASLLRLQADTFLAEVLSKSERYANWYQEHRDAGKSQRRGALRHGAPVALTGSTGRSP
jgi:hypothetical protein